ncbi:MAG: GTPase Era, partial [Clostridia bacterium]|nr:GTPase Era [Clostridia bacterium]
GVDACLLVVEAEGDVKPGEVELIEKMKKLEIPAVLAINKIDTLPDMSMLPECIKQFSKLYDFEAVVPVSAVKGTAVDELLDELEKLAQPSVHFFPDDTLTDQPERVIAGEIIREKLLRLLDKEVPHGIAVSIEKMREREDSDLMDIEAVIYCERETHKGIIIGKNGSMLKKVSTYARQDMEKFFDCHINLQCWVKVKEGWRDREALIHNFGLDSE